MSLTSYRAAPPRVKGIHLRVLKRNDVFGFSVVRFEDLAATYSPTP